MQDAATDGAAYERGRVSRLPRHAGDMAGHSRYWCDDLHHAARGRVNPGFSAGGHLRVCRSMAALILFLRVWKPKRILNANCQDITHLPQGVRASSRGELFRASVPWLILTLLVTIC